MRVVSFYAVLALSAVGYGHIELHDPQGLQVFEDMSSVLTTSPPLRTSNVGMCIKENFDICQANFNDDMGISSDLDWHSPQTLLYLINKFYKKGLDEGLLPLCQARAKLYQCLGTSYDLCIDRRYLVSQGATLADATIYVQIFKQLEFECVGGAIQSTQHWDKIEQVRLSPAYNTSVNQCVSTFNNETINNHDQTKVCKQAGLLAMCLSANFYDTCGHDCSWWECERVRAAFEVDGYCPGLTCTQTLIPSYNGHDGFYKNRADLIDKEFGSGSVAAHIRQEVMESASGSLH